MTKTEILQEIKVLLQAKIGVSKLPCPIKVELKYANPANGNGKGLPFAWFDTIHICDSMESDDNTFLLCSTDPTDFVLYVTVSYKFEGFIVRPFFPKNDNCASVAVEGFSLEYILKILESL